MPDYIYLLENRLSPDQQHALKQVREASRDAGMTVFLAGGAVRDLTSGSPVRDLDFSVQGDALKLRQTLEQTGAAFWGEHQPSSTLFLKFPGGVRVEISQTRREEYPTPGHAVYHPASILEDLRRRDFTANAMALSLNEGSYGLLMDPLNGVADIEARTLRLVSNYGFLEDPVRLIRATRLGARLGWELEEKTKTRFQNAREENVVDSISDYHKGYELEEIAHEEDGLKILKVLESEGWMQKLCPAWTSAKADEAGLEQMREVLIQLQMQGVNPDTSTAQMELLTAKMNPKEIEGLKHLIARPGFVADWQRLEEDAKEFAKILTGKQAATPSATWKLFTTSSPEAILWLGMTGKGAAVQTKFKNFFSVWPEARQKIPYALMQEMRITPEIDGYQDLLKSIFLELIDSKLTTDEEMRAFLEPHSPPAPPPPVSIRRTRSKKSAEPKVKIDEDEDEDEDGGIRIPAGDLDDKDDDLGAPEEDSDDEDEDMIPVPAAVKPVKAGAAKPVPAPAPTSKPEAPALKTNGGAGPAAKPPQKGAKPEPAKAAAAPATAGQATAGHGTAPQGTAAKKSSGGGTAAKAPSKPATPSKAPAKGEHSAKAKSAPAKPAHSSGAHASAAHPAPKPAGKAPSKPASGHKAPAKKATVAKKSASKPAPKGKLHKTLAKPASKPKAPPPKPGKKPLKKKR